MKSTKKAFSLIEVIISTVILTIGVFGVYKLIGSNMNLLSNNENYTQLNMLYKPLKECIKSIGYNSLSGSYNTGSGFSINFGNNNLGCFTGSYNDNLNFSGVIIDNREYFLYSKVIGKDSLKIDLELNIFNDTASYLFNSGSTNEEKNLVIYK